MTDVIILHCLDHNIFKQATRIQNLDYGDIMFRRLLLELYNSNKKVIFTLNT